MLLNNRHGSVDNDAYRYGFNGMERDDEVKGQGNSYDYGARMYDNRIGRWFATDPLEKKFAYLSPYAYSGNNPILFIDYNGKDFGIIVNHKDKTITVVANFYTNKENVEDLTKATTKWEELNGKYFYKTKSETGDDVYYEIKFDFNIKVAKEFEHKEGKFSITDTDVSSTTKNLKSQIRLNASNDDIGNSFIYADDDGHPFSQKDKKGNVTSIENRVAVTAGNKHITARNSKKGNATKEIIHEIGHVLNNGSGHHDSTYMSEAFEIVNEDGEKVDDLGLKEKFSIEVVEDLLRTVGIGYRKRNKNKIEQGKERDIVVDKGGLDKLNKKGSVVKKEEVPEKL